MGAIETIVKVSHPLATCQDKGRPRTMTVIRLLSCRRYRIKSPRQTYIIPLHSPRDSITSVRTFPLPRQSCLCAIATSPSGWTWPALHQDQDHDHLPARARVADGTHTAPRRVRCAGSLTILRRIADAPDQTVSQITGHTGSIAHRTELLRPLRPLPVATQCGWPAFRPRRREVAWTGPAAQSGSWTSSLCARRSRSRRSFLHGLLLFFSMGLSSYFTARRRASCVLHTVLDYPSAS
jgi:hypothetical protein